MRRLQPEALLLVAVVAGLALFVAVVSLVPSPSWPTPERHLGAGAVCSDPFQGASLCVHEGRLLTCVQNRRAGTISCAPTRAESARP